VANCFQHSFGLQITFPVCNVSIIFYSRADKKSFLNFMLQGLISGNVFLAQVAAGMCFPPQVAAVTLLN
jgi:hypothetical protein